ncbi:MAG: hypothetical protein JNM30_14000 [Rhodospirillales bacterium]|nr:hypothetical protein [Rhodospirillales bacterium]
MKKPTGKSAFMAGVFLLCMSVLMVQIIQTRILSVVSLYYMAFFSISMAMLGLTAGALFVYFKLGHVNKNNVGLPLARVTTAFALSTAICFAVQMALPLPIVGWATFGVIWLTAIILLAAPFVLGGIAVSLALTRSPYPVGQVYGVDLLGAATGCLVALVVLNLIDTPSAMFLVAAITAVAGCCFKFASPMSADQGLPGDWRFLRKPGVVAIALAVLAAGNSLTNRGFQPVSAKFGQIERIDWYYFLKWNSFSRIAVTESRKQIPFLWGASPALLVMDRIDQRMLDIDGFAGTAMPKYTDSPGSLDYLRYDVTNLAYHARNAGKAAVVGVGSGRDLLSAHLFGFRDIIGVELNPIFIDVLTKPELLRDYAGVAKLPGVRFVVDDGRSWFMRTSEKFDLVQMSMVDTFAATGTGAFSLSENGLYTVEGWKAFLAALKPDGLFTVSRWHSPTAPVEMGRVISLAVAALAELGVENPREHIYVAAIDRLATIVISRRPFASPDLTKLDAAAQAMRFNLLATPYRPSPVPVIEELLSARNMNDLTRIAAHYPLDVTPPTDSRPFFFNQLRLTHPEDIIAMLREWRSGNELVVGTAFIASGNLIAIGTLSLIVMLSAGVVLLVVLLPARASVRVVKSRFAIVGSTYFLLIGLGFMFVEIGLIQRISLFLGHPVYALGVALFSLILSTGAGSLLSERLTPRSATQLVAWLGLLTGYLLLLPAWLPLVTGSELAAANLAVRAAASAVVIFPAGLLMGFGFPTGMRLVNAIDPHPMPWFWGVNGAAGVLAAGLAVACSIGFSVDATIRVGAVCYALLLPCALALLALQHTKAVPATS